MKKGFTLIELLAVIVLLGIIGLIAAPTVTKVINQNKEKTLNQQKELIVRASKNWFNADPFIISADDNDQVEVTVGDLITSGYLEDFSSDEISTDDCVKINKEGQKIKFEFKPKNQCN